MTRLRLPFFSFPGWPCTKTTPLARLKPSRRTDRHISVPNSQLARQKYRRRSNFNPRCRMQSRHERGLEESESHFGRPMRCKRSTGPRVACIGKYVPSFGCEWIVSSIPDKEENWRKTSLFVIDWLIQYRRNWYYYLITSNFAIYTIKPNYSRTDQRHFSARLYLSDKLFTGKLVYLEIFILPIIQNVIILIQGVRRHGNTDHDSTLTGVISGR